MSNNHINYIEFKSKDLEKTEKFYSAVFGWKFTTYGPTYISFEESGVLGGFELTDKPIQNGVLVVLYHENLKIIKAKVIENGGEISVDTFEYPGGRRFQFLDHSGNELSVWSE